MDLWCVYCLLYLLSAPVLSNPTSPSVRTTTKKDNNDMVIAVLVVVLVLIAAIVGGLVFVGCFFRRRARRLHNLKKQKKHQQKAARPSATGHKRPSASTASNVATSMYTGDVSVPLAPKNPPALMRGGSLLQPSPGHVQFGTSVNEKEITGCDYDYGEAKQAPPVTGSQKSKKKERAQIIDEDEENKKIGEEKERNKIDEKMSETAKGSEEKSLAPVKVKVKKTEILNKEKIKETKTKPETHEDSTQRIKN